MTASADSAPLLKTETTDRLPEFVASARTWHRRNGLDEHDDAGAPAASPTLDGRDT